MSPTRERLIMRLEDAADFAEDGGHHIEVFANRWYKPDLNVNAEETPVGRRCHDAIERVGRHRRHPFDAITNGATTVQNGAGFIMLRPKISAGLSAWNRPSKYAFVGSLPHGGRHDHYLGCEHRSEDR